MGGKGKGSPIIFIFMLISINIIGFSDAVDLNSYVVENLSRYGVLLSQSFFNAEILPINSTKIFLEDVDMDGNVDEIFLTSENIIIRCLSKILILGKNNGLEIPTSLSAYDIDADGSKELIVVSHNVSSVASLPSGIKDKILIYKLPICEDSQPSVILNLQSFNEGGKYAKADSIVVGNFSQNGYDIVVNVYVQNDNGRIQVFDGPITSSVAPSQVILTSKGSQQMKSYDDNGDGFEDIYVLCSVDNRIEVFYKTQSSLSNTPNRRYNTQVSPVSYSVKNRTIAILSSTLLRIYRNFQLYGDFNIGGLWIEMEDFNSDGTLELAIAKAFLDTYTISYYTLSPALISTTFVNSTINTINFLNNKLYVCGSRTIITSFVNFKKMPAIAHEEFISIKDARGIRLYNGKYYIWNNSELEVISRMNKMIYYVSGIKEVISYNNLTCLCTEDAIFIIDHTTNNTTRIDMAMSMTDICRIEYDIYDVAIGTSEEVLILLDLEELKIEHIYSPPATRISSSGNIIFGVNSNYVWALNIITEDIYTYDISNMSGVSSYGNIFLAHNDSVVYIFELGDDIYLKNEFRVKGLVSAGIGDFCDEGNSDIILSFSDSILILETNNLSIKRKYISIFSLTDFSLGDLNPNGRSCISVVSLRSDYSIVQCWEYENNRPVAIIDVPDHILYENMTIFLDGRRSYDQYSDLYTLNYTWYKIIGSVWEIISYEKYVYYSPNMQGVYSFALEVRDDEGLSDICIKNVTVHDCVPVVDFYFTPSDIREGLKVEFYANCTSYDPIINYSWKISNETLFGKNISYIFKKNGSYEVELIVVDDDGSLSRATKVLAVMDTHPTVVGIEYYPLNPKEGENVSFRCVVSSYDPVQEIVWQFSDGKSFRGFSIVRNFSVDGKYGIRLLVRDVDNSTVESDFIIDISDTSPSVEIIGNSSFKEDEVFILDAKIKSYDKVIDVRWDLDFKGTFDIDTRGTKISHSYSKSGKYIIVVEVIDSDNSFARATKEITVLNVPPIAQFVISFQHENLVRLDASTTLDTKSDIPTLEYIWSFGDGTFGRGKIVEHRYEMAGRYYISLRVVDDDGAESFSGTYVVVTISNNRPYLYVLIIALFISLVLLIPLVAYIKIEDIYLIHRNGILLSHYSSKLKAVDEDTLSAMLVAILEFIRTAYKDENESLKSMDFKGKKIMVDRYRDLFLVVSSRRRSSWLLRKKMRKTLIEIWKNYENVFVNWDGDLEKIRGVGDILRRIWRI